MSGQMPSDEVQKDVFAQRLERVRDARTQFEQLKTVEPAKPMTPSQRRKQDFRPGFHNLLYPLAIVGAFGLGAVSVVVARAVRAWLTSGEIAGDGATLAMLLDFGLAAGAGYASLVLLRSHGKEFAVAQAVGALVMVTTMHNLVHAAPGVWAGLFPSRWVDQVVASTEPGTLLIRGVSVHFSEPTGETTVASADASAAPATPAVAAPRKPALPRVIELGGPSRPKR
jgi:hypothetical protein